MTVTETEFEAAELERSDAPQATLETIAKTLAASHQSVSHAASEQRPLLKDPQRHEAQLIRAAGVRL